jgi:pseudouridine kinase
LFVTTAREQQILELIREDPMISQHAIAARLGISRSAVAGHVMKLTNKGVIKGRGYVFGDDPFVVAIGGANMDIHGDPGEKLRQHDSNPGTVRTSPGGVARNVAENLARLGTDCRLISAVGNDHHGRLLLQLGRESGIDMQHVLQFESSQTSTYMSVLDQSGDMFVAINDMVIIEELTPERLQSYEATLKQAALLVLDTNLPEVSIEWLTNTQAENVIFVDTVSTVKALKIKPYLHAVHTLKTSRIEAEALTGMKTTTRADCRQLAAWIHKQGVSRLFMTMGKDGVFYSTADEQGFEKPSQIRRSVRNAGGAGDAFLAGLIYAWKKEWTLLKSIRFSMAAADVTLSDKATSSAKMSLAAVNKIYRGHYAC